MFFPRELLVAKITLESRAAAVTCLVIFTIHPLAIVAHELLTPTTRTHTCLCFVSHNLCFSV